MLESAGTGELQVLVANHDVHRPKIRGDPRTVGLVFDRASLGWQEVMEQRFYLYPVHTSNTFLLTHGGSLAATLYLLLLRVLGRAGV